jgi:Sec-independent protein secretion pathway components
MNILGIGGPELILILLIMLIVAGPKRMIAWAYTLGKYIARFRRMWEETVDVLQKEFDEAGVDIKVPRELPTRANLTDRLAKRSAV